MIIQKNRKTEKNGPLIWFGLFREIAKISPKRKQSFQHIRMEVDDAIVMTEPAEEETVLAGSGVSDNDGIDDTEIEKPISSASTSGKQKRAKIKLDKEEPPGVSDTPNNDSALTATPFKLEVSCSEDEKEEEDESDGVSKAAIRRKLLTTPLEEDSSAKDGLGEIEEVAVKRKRYEVRRSGSEECLLGFDELSGEAELVKAEATNDETDQHMAAEDEAFENASEPFARFEENKGSAESILSSSKIPNKVRLQELILLHKIF